MNDNCVSRKKGPKKIGEVAALFRTTPRTLLYYEEQGILSPCKTEKGTRLYSQTEIERFHAAYRLAGLGVPIKTIRSIIDARPGTADDAVSRNRKLEILVEGLLDDLRHKMRELNTVQLELQRGQQIIKNRDEDLGDVAYQRPNSSTLLCALISSEDPSGPP